MKQRYKDIGYMATAVAISLQSKARRKKIGAIIVQNTMVNGMSYSHIISEGVNGTRPGSDLPIEIDGATSDYVIHAEDNAILKAEVLGLNLKGATIYITHSPCPNCCNIIASKGITRVVYAGTYKDTSGFKQLNQNNIQIDCIPINEVYDYLHRSTNATVTNFSDYLRYNGFTEQQICDYIKGG